MDDTHLTPKRIECLRMLTRTGFVSTRHLEEAGIVTNATRYSQSTYFKPMLAGGYVGRVTVVSPYGIGKRVMYYLTRKGADLVAEIDGLDPNELRYTPLRGGIVKASDSADHEYQLVRANFPHKEAYVSALIALERYVSRTDYRVAAFRHDYDRKNGGTSLELAGKRFRPDGIAFLEPTLPSSPTYVYAIELHRHSDRKKIVDQLRRHAAAYKAGSMAKRFGTAGPYFVLSLYTNENRAAMGPVIEALRGDTETWPYVERYFLFADAAELFSDFYGAFHYFGGAKKPLPPVVTS